MQEHPIVRFLWMVPLGVMLLATVLFWNVPVGKRLDESVVLGCLSMFFAAGASAAFYQRDIKCGFGFLAWTIPGTLLLLDAAFGVLKPIYEHPILASQFTPIVMIVVVLFGGTYLTYKSNYLPAVFCFGALLFPVGLFLLINRIGALIGWW